MAVDKAEAGKHDKYDAICAAAGLQFIPIGADTFGAYGLEAQQFLSQLFQRYAKRSTQDDGVSFAGKLQCECWQRLSVALRKAVAKQLGQVFVELGGDRASPFSHS